MPRGCNSPMTCLAAISVCTIMYMYEGAMDFSMNLKHVSHVPVHAFVCVLKCYYHIVFVYFFIFNLCVCLFYLFILLFFSMFLYIFGCI